MHDDQLDVDEGLARRLIHEQFPQWADRDVRAVPSAATVNAIFRIGESLAARFPLRADDPVRVRRWLSEEADAAREFLTVSTVPAPEPVGLGFPGHGYPLSWSVQTWLPGCDGAVAETAALTAFAEDLATLILRLRSVETRGRRFNGKGRGGHLPDHDQWMTLCFDKSQHLLDVVSLSDLWAELRILPRVDADVMSHGDLTPPNVLVEAGQLVGVLDTGGFRAADPALDLVAVWHLLDSNRRALVRDRLQCSDTQWSRGRAWALEQAMGLVWYYAETNPVMSEWGKRTLDRLLATAS